MSKLYLKNLTCAITVVFVANFSTNTLSMEQTLEQNLESKSLESKILENKGSESNALENKSLDNNGLNLASKLEDNKPEVNVNNKDEYGRTPAFYAYLDGKFDDSKKCWDFNKAQELIANGAFPYSIILLDNTGKSPAFCACMAGKFDLAKKLLELGIIMEGRIAKYFFSYDDSEKNPLNLKDFSGQTPVFSACIEGKADLLKALISQGADLNVFDSLDKKPINYAQENGHHQIVGIIDPEKEKKRIRKLQSQLMKKAENKKKKNKKTSNCEKEEPKLSGAKAIVLAKTLSKKSTHIPEETKAISEKPANTPEEINTLPEKPTNTPEEIKTLHEKPANTPEEAKTPPENPEVMQAEKSQSNLESAEFEAFGNNPRVGEYDQKKLFLAYCDGDFDLADKMSKIRENSIINTGDEIGQTPIFHVILRNLKKEQTKIELEKEIEQHVTELIKRGANINHKNKLGQNPIFIAYSRGLKKVVTLLEEENKKNGIKKCAPEDLVDYFKQNPIFLAYCVADFETVKKLRSWGFKGEINMENSRKQSPLFVALINGHLEAAKKLMNATAYGEKKNALYNINRENKLFFTPLFHTYCDGNMKVAKLLKNDAIKYGFKENAKGDVLTKNSLGRSALFCAYAGKFDESIEILQSEILIEQEKLAKKMGKNYQKPDPSTTGIYEIDYNGWTPAFLACLNGSIDALIAIKRVCLDWETYINKQDKNGKTALDIAIEYDENKELRTSLIAFLKHSGAKAVYHKDFN